MKAIRIKNLSSLQLDKLKGLLILTGWAISNPHQKDGTYFYVITKDNRRIAGFDMTIEEGDYPVFDFNKEEDRVKADDWIKDHKLNFTTHYGDREVTRGV